MNSQAREVLRIAEALGFTVDGRDGSGHIRLRHSNGQVTSVPATPSEYRGLRNAQLVLERIAGKRLPRTKRGHSHKAFRPSGFSIEAAHREQQRWHAICGDDVAALTAERAALVERCQQLAQRRHNLRAIPPLLSRIASIETRLLDLHQPVERFDPYTLAEGA